MSEARSNRTRGRGLDAIFDGTDLDLGPKQPTEAPRDEASAEPNREEAAASRPRARHTPDRIGDGEPDPDADLGADRGANHRAGVRREERRVRGGGEARAGRGRPSLTQAPARQLVQRGFYLEPQQDRMLDEIKFLLKGRGFTPDRSAILRAAIEHFYDLDERDQEDLVRRAK